jgi:hypothetical protein
MRSLLKSLVLAVAASGCAEPQLVERRDDAGTEGDDAGTERDAATPDASEGSRDAGSDGPLALWLRADMGVLDLEGGPAATNGRVLRWVDQSARSFDATQDTEGARPTFAPEGGPNGGPAVVFDGTDDCLTLGANYIFSSNLGMTFFMVVRSDLQVPEPPHEDGASSSDPFLASFGAGSNEDWALLYDFDTVGFRAAARQVPYTAHEVGQGNWAILTYQLVFGQDMRVRINGEEVVWDDAVLVTQLTAAEIGEAPNRQPQAGPVVIGAQSKLEAAIHRYFGGAIAEVRIFDDALTASARDALECALSKAHGIALSPNHAPCE